MDKVKTGKALSAAAAANLAIAGILAAPAGAATHSGDRATASTVTAPAHWITDYEAPQSRLPSKPHGFVPRPARIIPLTGSSCAQHVCMGITGTGLHVSSENQHFWGWGGCHVATYRVESTATGQTLKSSHTTGCYNSYQGVHAPISGTWPEDVTVFAGFWNVPGIANLHVFS
jgi:hypothetical protein